MQSFLAQTEWLSSPLLVAALFVIVVCGAVVQFGMGMGFGIVAAPFMALIDPKLVPIPAIFMGIFTSLGAALQERHAINWSMVRVYLAGRFIGIIVATSVLAMLANDQHFLLFFGIITLFAVVLSLSGWQLTFSRTSLFGAASLSGLMATITSVGGPPIALLYANQPIRESRATIAAFFAIGGTLSIAALYASGWAGWQDTLLTIALIPPMLVGMLIAKLIGSRLDSRFRPILISLSAIAAILLIYRGLQ